MDECCYPYEISSALLCDAVRICGQQWQDHKNSFQTETSSVAVEYWPLIDVRYITEYYKHLCPLLTSPTRCLGAVGRRENSFLVIGGYIVKVVLPVDCNLITFFHFPCSSLLSGKMMHTDI